MLAENGEEGAGKLGSVHRSDAGQDKSCLPGSLQEPRRPHSSPQRGVMTGAEGSARKGPPLNTDVVLLPELLLL